MFNEPQTPEFAWSASFIVPIKKSKHWSICPTPTPCARHHNMTFERESVRVHKRRVKCHAGAIQTCAFTLNPPDSQLQSRGRNVHNFPRRQQMGVHVDAKLYIPSYGSINAFALRHRNLMVTSSFMECCWINMDMCWIYCWHRAGMLYAAIKVYEALAPPICSANQTVCVCVGGAAKRLS